MRIWEELADAIASSLMKVDVPAATNRETRPSYETTIDTDDALAAAAFAARSEREVIETPQSVWVRRYQYLYNAKKREEAINNNLNLSS